MRSASPGFSRTVGNESIVCKQLPENAHVYDAGDSRAFLHSVPALILRLNRQKGNLKKKSF